MVLTQGEFFACREHMIGGYEAVLNDLVKGEFMNVVIRHAKSKKCNVDNCKKRGEYLVLFQYFQQKDNRSLQ